jgi:aminoglycoside 3-N-acetyltransferase
VASASGEAEAIARAEAALGGPVTFDILVADLRRLGIPQGPPILVHSSLSALGWVAGGAHVVVDALLEAFGPSSTIVIPCQSGDRSDPVHWSNPPVPDHWLPLIRSSMPAFDPARVETRSMGRIVEAFRNDPRSVRGGHPTVSFAAIGPLASSIVEPHPLAPQFGEESPLARLYAAGATVLHLGTGFATSTALHLAEHRARWPGKVLSHADGAALLVDGKREWVSFEDEPADDDGFEAIGLALSSVCPPTISQVGAASAEWFPMVPAVDFAVSWMEQHRGGR